MATEDFQKAIASEAATKCIAKVQAANNGTTESSEANKSGCKHTVMKAIRCVSKEFFIACPTDLQDSSDKCVKLREAIENGGSKESAEGPGKWNLIQQLYTRNAHLLTIIAQKLFKKGTNTETNYSSLNRALLSYLFENDSKSTK